MVDTKTVKIPIVFEITQEIVRKKSRSIADSTNQQINTQGKSRGGIASNVDELLTSDLAMGTKVTRTLRGIMSEVFMMAIFSMPSVIMQLSRTLIYLAPIVLGALFGASLISKISTGINDLWNRVTRTTSTAADAGQVGAQYASKVFGGIDYTEGEPLANGGGNTVTNNITQNITGGSSGGGSSGGGSSGGTETSLPTITNPLPTSQSMLDKWGTTLTTYLCQVLPKSFVEILFGKSEETPTIELPENGMSSMTLPNNGTTGGMTSDEIENMFNPKTIYGGIPNPAYVPPNEVKSNSGTNNTVLDTSGLSDELTKEGMKVVTSINNSLTGIDVTSPSDKLGEGVVSNSSKLDTAINSSITNYKTKISEVITTEQSGIANVSSDLKTAVENETVLIAGLAAGPYKTLNDTLSITVSNLRTIKTLKDSISGLKSQLGGGNSSSNTSSAPSQPTLIQKISMAFQSAADGVIYAAADLKDDLKLNGSAQVTIRGKTYGG
jgi:hypothetical protein